MAREIDKAVMPHRIVWATDRSKDNLVSAGRDPAALECDVLYGQPDVADVLQSARVKWVQLTSAGYTRYDKPEVLDELRQKKIAFCNASSVYEEPCAQHALAMLLALARALPDAVRNQDVGNWDYMPLRERSFLLGGQKVLIVGYGAIARRLVELLFPYKLDITAFRRGPRGDENVKTLPIDQLDAHLPSANVVFNILPQSPATEHFFSRTRLALLPPTALYLSIGRGGTTDQEALANQLVAGQLGAACLDVTTPEPLPAGHRLWTTPRLFITPHTAGSTFDESSRMRAHLISQLRSYERGRELGDRVV